MSEAPTKGTRDRAFSPVREAVRRSVAHRAHAALGATFERRSTWEVPGRYTAEDGDPMKDTLGYSDISARGKAYLTGAVAPLLRQLTGGPIAPQHTASLRSGGIVACIARDWALTLGPPGEEGRVLTAVGSELIDVAATDMTSALSAFLVAGPRRDDFLARTITARFDDLRAGTCIAATWSKIPAVLVFGDLPEPAVEIYVASDFGRYAWSVVHDLGRHLGGSPVGWRALEAWGWS